MQTSSVRVAWKVILARGISIVVTGLLVFGICTGESNQRPKFELTETDITAIRNFRADQLTVYGVSLGMTKDEAESLLRANEGIIVEQDRWNPTRLYVYDKTPDGFKNRCILYYIWRPNDPGLACITVFEDCAKHLKGNTKLLLTLAALDLESDISKSFLRYPNRSKLTLDIPMIEVKHTTYYYEDKWLEVTHQHHMGDEGVVFALVRQLPRVVEAKEALDESDKVILAEALVTEFMGKMCTVKSESHTEVLMPYISREYFHSRWLDPDNFRVNSYDLAGGLEFRILKVKPPYVDVEVITGTTSKETAQLRFRVIRHQNRFFLFPSRAKKTKHGNWVDPWWASTVERATVEDFHEFIEALGEIEPKEEVTPPVPFLFENVRVWKIYRLRSGAVLGTELTGEIVNQSGITYNRAWFRVTLYGAAGKVLGWREFALFDVRDGERKRFKVLFYDIKPSDVRNRKIEFERGS